MLGLPPLVVFFVVVARSFVNDICIRWAYELSTFIALLQPLCWNLDNSIVDWGRPVELFVFSTWLFAVFP